MADLYKPTVQLTVVIDQLFYLHQMSDLVILIPVFFIIALFYSSAGFGGGSSYLAVLALFPMAFVEVRMMALVCNIAVVTGSVWVFYKANQLNLKRIWPLILLSVPLAYVGGRLRISEDTFFIILGITLLAAGILMLSTTNSKTRKLPLFNNGLIGGGIGFLSGVVGIGGGIFLSPVLHLSRWADVKVIAGTTALFILVNSIAGLIGQVVTNGFAIDITMVLSLVAAVILGGQIGARYTANKLNAITVKRITAVLILIVAIRILWKYI